MVNIVEVTVPQTTGLFTENAGGAVTVTVTALRGLEHNAFSSAT